MIHHFREVRILKQEGKLDKKLILRVRILFFISFLLAGIVIFNAILRSVDLLTVLILICIGFLLGLYVFSRINVVNWNEKEEILQIGRMDMIGYISLVGYIAFEIGFRTFLKDFYPVLSTVYLFCGIFGTLFGRAVGTVIAIHKVFLNT